MESYVQTIHLLNEMKTPCLPCSQSPPTGMTGHGSCHMGNRSISNPIQSNPILQYLGFTSTSPFPTPMGGGGNCHSKRSNLFPRQQNSTRPGLKCPGTIRQSTETEVHCKTRISGTPHQQSGAGTCRYKTKGAAKVAQLLALSHCVATKCVALLSCNYSVSQCTRPYSSLNRVATYGRPYHICLKVIRGQR